MSIYQNPLQTTENAISNEWAKAFRRVCAERAPASKRRRLLGRVVRWRARDAVKWGRVEDIVHGVASVQCLTNRSSAAECRTATILVPTEQLTVSRSTA